MLYLVPKTAWRYTPEQIHVVNFQSFKSYLADGLGCTTYSFALNLGIYFRTVPFEGPTRKGLAPSTKPQEYHCHFRRHLSKHLNQPFYRRADIWYIEPDGSNLVEGITDARNQIENDGLLWFDQFQSMEDVLRLLMEQDDLPEVQATKTSPARKFIVGHIAKSLGKPVGPTLVAEAESELMAIRVRVNSFTRGTSKTRP